MKRITKTVIAAGVAGLMVVPLFGCGNGGGSKGAAASTTVSIAYTDNGDNSAFTKWMKNAKTQFEKANKGATLKLVPVKAAGDDYSNKLSLMNRSASTAPDLMFLDSANLRPYVESEFLAPLDEYTKGWADWNQYFDNVKEVGKGDDGKVYGISLGTDTRGIWYRKDILASVGIKDGWQPKTWDELLDVARKIKAKNPDVIPLNFYNGKAQAEAGVMQGFEMLLSGTKGGKGTLYDPASKKWVVGSQAFKDSLGFIDTIFKEKLAPTPQEASDPQLGNKVPDEWLPKGKVAMTVEGNWLGSTWEPGGDYVWPEWKDKIGWTGFPTQTGDKKMTTMSGGWVVAMSSKAKNKPLAFKAIEVLQSKDNAKSYYKDMGQIAVRKDIEKDPDYLKAGPTTAFFTQAAEFTHYRPMTSKYNEVSSLISVATDSVMTGQQTVSQAQDQYDKSLTTQLGEKNVTKG